MAKNGEPPLDIAAIPLDDKKSFDMLQMSESTAVFQLASRGMKDLIKRLQPDCFEDMIALVALFRPGPLQSGMVDNFIDRKHGREEIPSGRTVRYGKLPKVRYHRSQPTAFQSEQSAQIARCFKLFSVARIRPGRMGKKKPEEMAGNVLYFR
ncbi:hypothetical protein F4W66_25060 (plasmid) [Escherichia coli]|nr:hypothetical protein F4W66_25060 [Escherichia coli]